MGEACYEFIAAVINSEQTIEFPQLIFLTIDEPKRSFTNWPFNFPPNLDFSLSVSRTLETPYISINWKNLTYLTVACSIEYCITVVRFYHLLVDLTYDCSDLTGEADTDSGLEQNPHCLPLLAKITFKGRNIRSAT